MRLLLDTNVLLWTMAGDARGDHLRDRLLDEDNAVYVSAASFWEIAIKAGSASSTSTCGSCVGRCA